MKALKIIATLILKIFIFFRPLYIKVKDLRQSLYDKWLCTIMKCKNVKFYFPVNMIVGSECFKIGNNTYFGKFVVLTAWKHYNDKIYKPTVIIGKDCGFNDYLHLSCINKIIIGNGVRVGRWVSIIDNAHGLIDSSNLKLYPHYRDLYSKGPIIIEDGVWIGDKCTILAGITIGEGSVIAANAVVTKDIPPYSVAAGNPAKIIKQINV